MEIVERENSEVKTTVSYRELKIAMDSEMGKAAESFVRIGYLFKMARDTDVLQESGYTSYLEFAQKEYGMDKSQVSRFINIHTKFSDPEDPTRLNEKYQGFGSAKLALMLTLPDTIIEELTPTFAKSDIQAVKEEIEAEGKVSDLEIIAEQAETTKEPDGQQDILHQVVDQILDGDLYMRIKIRQALKSARKDALIQEILAPAGEAMHSVRIKGVGRLMLSVKGLDTEIALINVRSDSKEMYTWETVIRAVEDYCTSHTDPEPEKKTEVAPVQPTEKPEKKERKVSKVTKAREAEKLPSRSRKVPQEEAPSEQTAPEIPTTPVAINSTAPAGFVGDEKAEEGNRQQEPQLEGQMEIEQFPQYLPENYIKCHDGSEVQESEDARIRAEWRRHVENICTPILTYLRQHPELIQKITITEEGIVIE